MHTHGSLGPLDTHGSLGIGPTTADSIDLYNETGVSYSARYQSLKGGLENLSTHYPSMAVLNNDGKPSPIKMEHIPLEVDFSMSPGMKQFNKSPMKPPSKLPL